MYMYVYLYACMCMCMCMYGTCIHVSTLSVGVLCERVEEALGA